MRRSLSFALPPLCCAVLQLALAAQPPHQARTKQTVPVASVQVGPIYWLAVQSNFSREALSGPDLILFRTGIEQQLGRPRCRVASESQVEIEKDIEKDGSIEALYIQNDSIQKKPKVVLWARCKDHDGKIAEFQCDSATGGRCLELALRDFPADISNHDAVCHRGKSCRADTRLFIVPLQ